MISHIFIVILSRGVSYGIQDTQPPVGQEDRVNAYTHSQLAYPSSRLPPGDAPPPFAPGPFAGIAFDHIPRMNSLPL